MNRLHLISRCGRACRVPNGTGALLRGTARLRAHPRAGYSTTGRDSQQPADIHKKEAIQVGQKSAKQIEQEAPREKEADKHQGPDKNNSERKEVGANDSEKTGSENQEPPQEKRSKSRKKLERLQTWRLKMAERMGEQEGKRGSESSLKGPRVWDKTGKGPDQMNKNATFLELNEELLRATTQVLGEGLEAMQDFQHQLEQESRATRPRTENSAQESNTPSSGDDERTFESTSQASEAMSRKSISTGNKDNEPAATSTSDELEATSQRPTTVRSIDGEPAEERLVPDSKTESPGSSITQNTGPEVVEPTTPSSEQTSTEPGTSGDNNSDEASEMREIPVRPSFYSIKKSRMEDWATARQSLMKKAIQKAENGNVNSVQLGHDLLKAKFLAMMRRVPQSAVVVTALHILPVKKSSPVADVEDAASSPPLVDEDPTSSPAAYGEDPASSPAAYGEDPASSPDTDGEDFASSHVDPVTGSSSTAAGGDSVSSPAVDEQNSVSYPDMDSENSVLSPAIDCEDSVLSPAIDGENPVSSSDADGEDSASSSSADGEHPVSSPGADGESSISSPNTDGENSVSSSGADGPDDADSAAETGSKPVPRAMTLGSFTSLTLTPEPTIMFNISLPSRTYEAIKSSGYFNLHVLSDTEDGAALAQHLSKPQHLRPPPDRLSEQVRDCLASLESELPWPPWMRDGDAPPEELGLNGVARIYGKNTPLIRIRPVLYVLRCSVAWHRFDMGSMMGKRVVPRLPGTLELPELKTAVVIGTVKRITVCDYAALKKSGHQGLMYQNGAYHQAGQKLEPSRSDEPSTEDESPLTEDGSPLSEGENPSTEDGSASS
ncbi:hypothetical protein JX265_003286 [Neoarthrinium moseri]|uniref:Flavin reductase like domain-containing protein n=1 Tax=Neoarthrinium moseri TaxID=1658444 RepID=A0A9P9WTY6_9PEZI|nr:hypothetical protein JX265_003286 [Neoarthrinium moseri]